MQELIQHQPTEEPARAADRMPWTMLILLGVAQFMVILDVTVVNVALPSIRSALRFAPQDLQWVVSAYVIAGVLALIAVVAVTTFRPIAARRVIMH